MDQGKNGLTKAQTANQMRGQPAGQTRKPDVMQPKKPPVAPPVYSPQTKPLVAQRKATHTPQTPPIAPPVYRPQQTPKVLQTKSSLTKSPHAGQAARQPVAPPVYRPQPVPRVLQTKSSSAQSPHAGLVTRQPVVATEYRPDVKIAPPKAISQHRKPLTAPINHALSGVAQRASVHAWRVSSERVGSTRVIQRMETTKTTEIKFSEVLGTEALYNQKPTLVVTFSNEKAEQTQRLNEITSYYKNLKCSVKGSVMWDYEKGEMSNLSKQVSQKLKQDCLLVVTGHGNLQFLFGALPGSEAEAMKGFVTWLEGLEKSTGCKLSTIVLDSCWSAAELKEPVEGVSSDSSARILSRLLGGDYKVIGFNGKACTGFVAYRQSDGGLTKADYGANAVVFIGGKVIKGSTHKETGKGITHSSDYINTDHEFYKASFPGEKPKLFRTNSFSGASEKNQK